jgi:ribosome-associated translation inhibitor RaiA
MPLSEFPTTQANRDHETAHRRPMPAWVPRSAKRASGRADALRTPAHVRVIGVELSDDDSMYIRRKLGMKLGKFATSIERVSVRVTDVNGPRGGVDQVCRIRVVLSGLPSVVIERRHLALHAAVDIALRATERAVRRSVGRRRMKPLHGRNSRRTAGGAGEPAGERHKRGAAERLDFAW